MGCRTNDCTGHADTYTASGDYVIVEGERPDGTIDNNILAFNSWKCISGEFDPMRREIGCTLPQDLC
jgi:hypothetical protein